MGMHVLYISDRFIFTPKLYYTSVIYCVQYYFYFNIFHLMSAQILNVSVLCLLVHEYRLTESILDTQILDEKYLLLSYY